MQWTLLALSIPPSVLIAGWFLQPRWGWLVSMALLVAFIVLAGRRIVGRWRGAFIDERNKISLSRFQTVVWTVLIVPPVAVGHQRRGVGHNRYREVAHVHVVDRPRVDVEGEYDAAPLVVGRHAQPEVVQGHTMSQEQFSKYRPRSCQATRHPPTLGPPVGCSMALRPALINDDPQLRGASAANRRRRGLVTGLITGAEALARWCHPTRAGCVPSGRLTAGCRGLSD